MAPLPPAGPVQPCSRRASTAPTTLAKPSPSTLRHNWHKPSPEMSSRAEGGEKREAKGWMWDGVQINLHTQQSSQVYCQAAGLGHGVGGVNRNTPTTRTRNTHIVTRGTRTKHALSTLSPPRVPRAACRREAGARGRGPAFTGVWETADTHH